MPGTSIKKRITFLFLGEIGTCKNCRIIDRLKYSVSKFQMFFTFPDNSVLCQHVVVAADAKSDASVFLIGQLCIRSGIEVQINHIVQCADSGRNNLFHIRGIRNRKMTEGETGEIAHHEFSGSGHSDNDGVSVCGLYFFAYFFNCLHILGNLGTEVGAVDHSGMSVRIHAVDRISVKCKRSSGFGSRPKNQADDIFECDCPFGNTGILYTIQIAAFPFFSKVVFQMVSLCLKNLMRTH